MRRAKRAGVGVFGLGLLVGLMGCAVIAGDDDPVLLPVLPPAADPPPPPAALMVPPRAYFNWGNVSGPTKLFVTDLDPPGTGVRLTDVSLGKMGSFLLPSPSNELLLYAQADAVPGTSELYVVNPLLPEMATKLSPAMVAGGNVSTGDGGIAWRPGHDQAIYLANQDDPAASELYMVDLATPGVSTKLSGPLVAGGWVFRFQVDATGRWLVYEADQDTDGVKELYLVDLDAPGTTTKLNHAFSATESLARFAIDETGTRYAYTVFDLGAFQFNLYGGEIAAPGVVTLLNGPPSPGTFGVSGFQFVPGRDAIVFGWYTGAPPAIDRYLVSPAAPGVTTRLSGGVAGAVSNVADVLVAPDGHTVAYRATATIGGAAELYVGDLDAPGTWTKVSGALVVGGEVSNCFRFTDDGAHLVYVADEQTAGVGELFAVPLAAPGASFKLNPPLFLPGRVYDTGIYVDGDDVIFKAEIHLNRARLYRVNLGAPGVAVQVDGMDDSDSRHVYEYVIAQ